MSEACGIQRRDENQRVGHRYHRGKAAAGDPGKVKYSIGDPNIAAGRESSLVTYKMSSSTGKVGEYIEGVLEKDDSKGIGLPVREGQHHNRWLCRNAECNAYHQQQHHEEQVDKKYTTVTSAKTRSRMMWRMLRGRRDNLLQPTDITRDTRMSQKRRDVVHHSKGLADECKAAPTPWTDTCSEATGSPGKFSSVL